MALNKLMQSCNYFPSFRVKNNSFKKSVLAIVLDSFLQIIEDLSSTTLPSVNETIR